MTYLLKISKKDMNLMRKAERKLWLMWYKTGNFEAAQYTPMKEFRKFLWECDVLKIGDRVNKNRLGAEYPCKIRKVTFRLPRKERARLEKFTKGMDPFPGIS